MSTNTAELLISWMEYTKHVLTDPSFGNEAERIQRGIDDLDSTIGVIRRNYLEVPV